MKGTISDWEADRARGEIVDDIGRVHDLPETAELHRQYVAQDTGVTLLERNYAGLRVTIDWLPVCGVTLVVQEGERPPVAVEIDPAKAFDAFNHPYCYLPA